MVISRLFILFCLALIAPGLLPAAHAADWETSVTPFQPGDFPAPRAVHAQYAFGWSGLTAATADVRFAKSGDGNFQLDATGATVGVARALWRYDVTHHAVANATTLRPVGVMETEKTRSKETETHLAFSPSAVVSDRVETKAGQTKTKQRRFEFPNVLSLESALLFLRSQPMPVGASYRVVVYPATSSYLCTVTVEGRERITVPAGSYDSVRLDVQLSKINRQRALLPHKKFRKATVWLSDDNDRMTLRVEAQVFVGKVFAELRAVEFNPANPSPAATR